MSRGSKIYRRFGLKWALAYRCKKLKTKIKSKQPLFLQNALMFFRVLKLKSANKFKIYQILIQCHCLIEKQTHLEFIALHYEEINSWLNSQEFKAKYLETNHPYPPLLNPERLNAKYKTKERDSKENNNDNIELEELENENTEYQSIESQIKEKDSINYFKEPQDKQVEFQTKRVESKEGNKESKRNENK